MSQTCFQSWSEWSRLRATYFSTRPNGDRRRSTGTTGGAHGVDMLRRRSRRRSAGNGRPHPGEANGRVWDLPPPAGPDAHGSASALVVPRREVLGDKAAGLRVAIPPVRSRIRRRGRLSLPHLPVLRRLPRHRVPPSQVAGRVGRVRSELIGRNLSRPKAREPAARRLDALDRSQMALNDLDAESSRGV